MPKISLPFIEMQLKSVVFSRGTLYLDQSNDDNIGDDLDVQMIMEMMVRMIVITMILMIMVVVVVVVIMMAMMIITTTIGEWGGWYGNENYVDIKEDMGNKMMWQSAKYRRRWWQYYKGISRW